VEAIEEYLNKEVVEGVTALERPPKFSVEVDIDD